MYAVIDNLRIRYLDNASVGKKTLVFLHGLGGSIESWDNDLSYLSKKYRVVAFDLPGFGRLWRFDGTLVFRRTWHLRRARGLRRLTGGKYRSRIHVYSFRVGSQGDAPGGADWWIGRPTTTASWGDRATIHALGDCHRIGPVPSPGRRVRSPPPFLLPYGAETLPA